MDLTLTPIGDFDALAARWRGVEAASPFLSWHFIGALAARRYDAPLLLAVREGGADVALAVMNRAGRKLHLNATGDARWDAVFIEHNGLVGREADVTRVLGAALRQALEVAPVVLAGVDDRYLAAARAVGVVTRHQARFAPCVDPTAVRGAFLEGLSANARGQIGRAMRLCGDGLGIARAADAATAQDWFAEMVALHQASWQARGQAGAFAAPEMRAFHAAVIASGFADRTAQLLRVTAGGWTVGVLYNLVRGGHVCAYQSGFAAVQDAREKPGLVCHTLAIELYRSESATKYDLLAGAARYKTTLTGSGAQSGARTGGQMLHWFTLHPKSAIGARARRLAEAVAARARRTRRLGA
jgi:CelD/BcsL family acetyltransferase involved in cellulose biosynthesis